MADWAVWMLSTWTAARPGEPSYKEIVSRPRFLLTAIQLSVIPLMMIIIFVTTLFEFYVMSKIRSSSIGKWIGTQCNTVVQRIAAETLRDQRNAPFLFIYIGISLLVIPFFFYCLYYELTHNGAEGESISLILALTYHCVRMGPMFVFFAYVAALTHMEAHEPVGFFTPKYKWFNRYIDCILSVFYGHVPMTYRIGHNKLHHATPTNGPHDYLCTRAYRRDSVKSMIDYLGKFALGWNGISIIDHCFRHKLPKLAWKQIHGVLYYLAIISVFACIHWKFTLVYLIFPNIEACNYLAGINFVWHAFAEKDQPDNEYIESCTILDGWYPVYNMDYHLVHHENPCMQFTEIPNAFRRDLELYKENRATIVKGTHEFELLFWIILQRYDLIEKCWVDPEELNEDGTVKTVPESKVEGADDKAAMDDRRKERLAMIERRLKCVDERGNDPTIAIPRPLMGSPNTAPFITPSSSPVTSPVTSPVSSPRSLTRSASSSSSSPIWTMTSIPSMEETKRSVSYSKLHSIADTLEGAIDDE